MNRDAEYLKNELKNYNSMKTWIENDSYVFEKRIRYLERKIKDIDMKLSSGNAKGIDYSQPLGSGGYSISSDISILADISEQEEYIKQKNKLLELKEKDVFGFKARIKYIEECLDKLENDERKFIVEYYCNGKSIEELINNRIIFKSESKLYRDKDLLILKMI